ncbi:hypothetical protein D3C77_545990 [compost metagenome]
MPAEGDDASKAPAAPANPSAPAGASAEPLPPGQVRERLNIFDEGVLKLDQPRPAGGDDQ